MMAFLGAIEADVRPRTHPLIVGLSRSPVRTMALKSAEATGYCLPLANATGTGDGVYASEAPPREAAESAAIRALGTAGNGQTTRTSFERVLRL